MESSVIIIICSLLCSHIIFFSAGIFLGFMIPKGYSQEVSRAPVSFLKSQKEKDNHKIQIDDKKVVLNVSTDGLEKKFDKITEEKKTKNNISNSVNKLKSMKGK